MAEIQIARIKSLYSEAKGYFDAIKDKGAAGPYIVPRTIVDNYNIIVDDVSHISGTDYTRSKIPKSELRPIMSYRLVKPLMASFVGRLEQEYNFNQSNNHSPVTQTKSFHFVSDADLRKILERDYQEIQKSMISANWKSTIILSGGAIEAILLDLVLKNAKAVKNCIKIPTGKPKPNDWSLNDLIEISLDTKLVGGEIGRLTHSVRQYRNLIHPAVELREKMKVEPEEAKIAVEVLNILIRELS